LPGRHQRVSWHGWQVCRNCCHSIVCWWSSGG